MNKPIPSITVPVATIEAAVNKPQPIQVPALHKSRIYVRAITYAVLTLLVMAVLVYSRSHSTQFYLHRPSPPESPRDNAGPARCIVGQSCRAPDRIALREPGGLTEDEDVTQAALDCLAMKVSDADAGTNVRPNDTHSSLKDHLNASISVMRDTLKQDHRPTTCSCFRFLNEILVPVARFPMPPRPYPDKVRGIRGSQQ